MRPPWALVLLLVGAFLLLGPRSGGGEGTEPRVTLNEVLYDAVGSDTGAEWIELTNSGDGPGDLGGWSIERGGASFSLVFTFPDGTTLAPGAFLVVGESAVEEADLTATLALQNGGDATDGVRLRDTGGRVVDVLLYDAPNRNALPDETGSPGASFAPDVAAGHSLARIPDGVDTNASGADFVEVAVPTPGVTNVPPPTPTPTPPPNLTGVVVNEALPNPVGSDADGEFIELHHTGSEAVALEGALLDDEGGGSAPYVLPSGTTIAGGGFLSFARSETGLALNNTGDRARLLTAEGVLVSELVFEASPQEGAAWARTDDGAAAWTLTPTPGGANVLTPLTSETGEETATPTPAPTASPTPVPAVSLAEARAAASGTRVLTTGVVSAPPGVLGRSVFYLAGSGLQVSVTSGALPDLAVGDRVSVEGVRSSVRGEARLRVRGADIQKVGVGAPPAPWDLTTGAVGESVEGTLVRVRGQVVRLSGNTVEIDDGSGPIRILVKRTTGWARPALSRGQTVMVVGIVSQWEETYRILPRFRSDLLPGEAVRGVSAVRARSRERRAVRNEPRETPVPTPQAAVSEMGGESAARARLPAALPPPTLVSWSAAGVLSLVRLFLRRA